MQTYYALYDSDFANAQTVPGVNQPSQWTWWADVLLYKTLNAFYGDVLKNRLPPRQNDFWSGIVRYEDYTVVYRFYCGAYKDGRDGRYVVLTAWHKSAESNDMDLSAVFDSPIWEYVDNHYKQGIVAKPNELSQQITGKSISATMSDTELLKRFIEFSATRTLPSKFIISTGKENSVIEFCGNTASSQVEIERQQWHTQVNEMDTQIRNLQQEKQQDRSQINKLQGEINSLKSEKNTWKIFFEKFQCGFIGCLIGCFISLAAVIMYWGTLDNNSQQQEDKQENVTQTERPQQTQIQNKTSLELFNELTMKQKVKIFADFDRNTKMNC